MKRIAGSFLLLAGLSGCMAVSGPPSPPRPSEAAATEVKPSPAMTQANAVPAILAPTYSKWQADPGHFQNEMVIDYRVARAMQPNPPASLPAGLAASDVPVVPPPPPAPPAPGSVSLAPQLQGTSSSPLRCSAEGSLAPQLQGTSSSPLRCSAEGSLAPQLQGTSSSPPRCSAGRLDDMPNSIVPPVVTPPRPAAVVQASCTTTQEVSPVRLPTDKSETLPAIGAVRTQIPVPPMPVAKDAPPTPVAQEAAPAESKVFKGGPPLVRLVNTKRITLNFEVKDVGPSGLASVELWYTKDCHDWKKHDAPTKAKAYVVEVEGEGMYGFTLLARSGTGMGREKPAPGDQPQVWVIVDLTRPEVKLTEVKATLDAPQQQQLTVKWSASDRNLGHRPISLFWSETPEGPWKVMATNLENTGKYVWPVPKDAPPRFLVKVEATDLAGNVGSTQSPPPAVLDQRVPTVAIVGVESNSSH